MVSMGRTHMQPMQHVGEGVGAGAGTGGKGEKWCEFGNAVTKLKNTETVMTSNKVTTVVIFVVIFEDCLVVG